jgi:hypothetical protein
MGTEVAGDGKARGTGDREGGGEGRNQGRERWAGVASGRAVEVAGDGKLDKGFVSVEELHL